MGCMCMDCKYREIVTDNHDNLHGICVCAESENFLTKVFWEDCDFGEVDMEESEDTE